MCKCYPSSFDHRLWCQDWAMGQDVCKAVEVKLVKCFEFYMKSTVVWYRNILKSSGPVHTLILSQACQSEWRGVYYPKPLAVFIRHRRFFPSEFKTVTVCQSGLSEDLRKAAYTQYVHCREIALECRALSGSGLGNCLLTSFVSWLWSGFCSDLHMGKKQVQ